MMLHAMIQPVANAPDDRATEFQAVADTGEHYSGYTLMVEAYAAIWLVLMVWLVFIWRKTTDLSTRIDGLENAIARAESKQASGKSGKEKPSPATGDAAKETTA